MAMAMLAEPALAGPARWPLWPNEVAQRTEALREGSDAPEAARAAAMRQTEGYPDALVRDLIMLGLQDESYEVRREAMRACVDRNLRECLPAAYEAWMNTDDPALRARALDLFAAHPDEGRAELLVEALLDDDPGLRDRAATALARVELSTEMDAKVRTLLSSKLDDVTSAVRLRAAEAMGLRGPGPGAVALVRRLDDPDPAVRATAAEALGRLEDPSAAAALIRALERDPDRGLATAGLLALTRLPGASVDEALLRFFDRPPLDRRDAVVEAIGLRLEPAPSLVDGLIVRLREPSTHDDALSALRLLGRAALPGIESAIERGLEPSLADELEALASAFSPASSPTDANTEASGPSVPPASASSPFGPVGHAQASAQMQPADARRFLRDAEDPEGAALALAAADPAWLADAIAGAVAQSEDARVAELWLWALAAHPGGLEFNRFDGAALVTRLAGWANDGGVPAELRCLASQALGSPALLADERRRRLAAPELLALGSDPHAQRRACAANGLARLGETRALTLLLLDTHPGVRGHAALATIALPPKARNRSVLNHLERNFQRDLDLAASSCAALALAAELDEEQPAPLTPWRIGQGQARAQPWAEFELEGRSYRLPVLGTPTHKWVWVPGTAAGRVPEEIRSSNETAVNELQQFSW